MISWERGWSEWILAAISQERYSWTPQYDDRSSPLEKLEAESFQLLVAKYQYEKYIIASTLCKFCQKLWQTPPRKSGIVIWKYDGSKSIENAVSGCRCCEFYWRLLGGDDAGRIGPENKIAFTIKSLRYLGDARPDGQNRPMIVADYSISGTHASTSMISTWFTSTSSPGPYIREAVLARNGKARLVPKIGRFSDDNNSTNSIASFEIAKFWLQDCLSDHAECTKPFHVTSRQQRTLPTRLVDLGEGQRVHPQIRLGATLPRETKYTTLSHCWGNRKFMTLRESNAEAFQRRIPIHGLSKTFRDAMEVSKRLGVRYIWIDSLCIIQDSPEDWATESSRMAEVYGNSILNIAATAAHDGSFGCFQSRDLNQIHSPWLGINLESDQYVLIQEGDSGLSPAMDRDVRSRIKRSALYRRAWVVQEVVLAPRTLHFMGDQIVWQCSRKTECESGIKDSKEPSLDDNNWTFFYDDVRTNYGKIKFPQPVTEPSSDDHLQRYQRQVIICWNSIVSLYSGAELTFDQQDKLVAISGVAKAIHDDFGQYISGLWRFYLPDQLLWYSFQTRRTQSRDRLEFPTWSWASVIGQVHNKFLDNEKYDGNFCVSEIVEGQVEEDGAVKGAFLKVEADLFFGRLLGNLFHGPNCDMSSGAHKDEATLEQCSCSPFRLSSSHVHWDSCTNEDGDAVYGAIIKDHDILTGMETKIMGILLSPSPATGGFTRVGQFTFWNKAPTVRTQPSLAMRLCQDSEAHIASQPDLYEGYTPAMKEQERPRFVFRIY